MMGREFLTFARYQDTVHTLQLQISKGGDAFNQELMASSLEPGFTWAETSCSEGPNLV